MGFTSAYQIPYCFAIKGGSGILKAYIIFMDKKSKPTDQYIYEYREMIGKSIRALREKKGYSQDELAEIMQVHRSTISKVESGKFSISIDYLVKFAWYLDFDISVIEKEA